jgi:branched-chain amino acid transport system substrate-binding protein
MKIHDYLTTAAHSILPGEIARRKPFEKTVKKFSAWFSVLLIALILAGCAGGSGEPTNGDVVVYVGVPLTGFQANAGQTVLGGVRLAAAEANRSGGLNGYRVVVRGLDDESTDDVAVANVQTIQEAIARGDKVLGVIGHLNSGQTLAAMAEYSKMALVVVTPTASEPSITAQNYKNFFRVNANDTIQADTLTRFLTQKLGAKSVAVIYNDSSYGKTLGAEMKKRLAAAGAKIAVDLQVKEGQSTFPVEVPKVQSAAPDAIFYAGYEIETPYLREALVTAGIQAPMVASDGAFLSVTIDESNGTAEGMYISAFAPSPKMASATWFEGYQAVESRNPDTYSVNGYVAMSVLLDAARKANAFDSSKVADALRSGTFKTLLGDLKYQPNGDLVDAKIWVYQVKDSSFQQVEW